MKVKVKKVYYCDYCGKHRLRSIIEHENHCTLNPDRQCRACEKWKDNKKKIDKVKKDYDILMSHKGKDGATGGGIVGTFCKEFEDKIKNMSDEISCPFCMLSILRQSGIGLSWIGYNYKDEVEKYWLKRNEEESEEDFYSRRGY